MVFLCSSEATEPSRITAYSLRDFGRVTNVIRERWLDISLAICRLPESKRRPNDATMWLLCRPSRPRVGARLETDMDASKNPKGDHESREGEESLGRWRPEVAFAIASLFGVKPFCSCPLPLNHWAPDTRFGDVSMIFASSTPSSNNFLYCPCFWLLPVVSRQIFPLAMTSGC